MEGLDIEVIDNDVRNGNEILFEVKKPEIDKLFASRDINAVGTAFKTLDEKNTTMYTLHHSLIPDYLKKICTETVNFEHFPKPDVCINKYPKGSWLGKHKDSAGAYWKFQLIFLQSTKDHFTWYDEDNNSHLVNEIPGRCIELPLHITHESTTLEPYEDIKYSMVFTWGGQLGANYS